jgi:hypothetical protein
MDNPMTSAKAMIRGPLCVFWRTEEVEGEHFALAGSLYVESSGEELESPEGQAWLRETLRELAEAKPYRASLWREEATRSEREAFLDDEKRVVSWAAHCIRIEVPVPHHAPSDAVEEMAFMARGTALDGNVIVGPPHPSGNGEYFVVTLFSPTRLAPNLLNERQAPRAAAIARLKDVGLTVHDLATASPAEIFATGQKLWGLGAGLQ